MKKFTLIMACVMLSGALAFSATDTKLQGKWVLANVDNCMAVGPKQGSAEWWGLKGKDKDSTRLCIMDDTIVFRSNGVFQNIMGAETWIEPWQGTEGCFAPIAPFDGSAAATYSVTDKKLTVNGKGAHIGLPKVYDGGELTSPDSAKSTINYTEYKVISGGTDPDTLVVDINFKAGDNWWRFVYEKAASIPDEPVSGVATVSASKLTISPNPASDVIYVNSNNVNIFDLTGKLVLKSSASKVDVSSLKAGLYVVKAGNEAQKLIIK